MFGHITYIHVVKNLTLKEKKAFISNKIESSASCKELFYCTNQLLGEAKNCTNRDCIPIHELPDAFSTCFTDKIMKIRGELDRTHGCPGVAPLSL